MRKLTLQKNLEMGGALYLEGQEVELENDIYDYIVNSYVIERRQMAENLLPLEEPVTHFFKEEKKGRK